jgi:serine phosphatase RsbU (regulator of sigma subunit)
VVEARNQKGEEWEVQGLLKAAAYGEPRSQNAGDLVDSIFRSMDDFSEGHQTDDATLAVVRVI